jgi:hypothetical protein
MIKFPQVVVAVCMVKGKFLLLISVKEKFISCSHVK